MLAAQSIGTPSRPKAAAAPQAGSAPAPADIITRVIPKTREKLPAIGLGTFLTFDIIPGQRRDHLRELRRIFDYIEANLHRELRIADLARMAEVTPSYFHRAFRLTTGQTPLAYITERRVRRAMPLLARADVSIAETCVRVGFVSPAHFTRVFRGATRMNPSDYRASFSLPPATRPSERMD